MARRWVGGSCCYVFCKIWVWWLTNKTYRDACIIKEGGLMRCLLCNILEWWTTNKNAYGCTRRLQCGEHKWRNFKASYLTSKLTIREYSFLGQFGTMTLNHFDFVEFNCANLLKYSIWAKSDEKCLQNVLPTYLSTFLNLRLGGIKWYENVDKNLR